MAQGVVGSHNTVPIAQSFEQPVFVRTETWELTIRGLRGRGFHFFCTENSVGRCGVRGLVFHTQG